MAKPRRGRRSSLAEEPHVEAIKKALAKQGFDTLTEAAKTVGFHLNVLDRLIRRGLPADPRQSTLDRLDRLGILELVRNRHSA